MSEERLNLSCAELDVLLCDYVDGTLAEGTRAAVENHLAGCASCAELAGDAAAAVGFLERVSEIQPPPQLITKILHQIPARQPAAVRAKKGLAGLLGKWFEPVLQPRLVMGMAMTILSFAMLGRFAGIETKQLRAADLEPAKVWATLEDQGHRSWSRAVKYYESLRLVYELQTRLREWKEEDEVEAQTRPAAENKTEIKTKTIDNVGAPRR